MSNLELSIPLTIIGGFLGAGKTTLVNHLLQTSRGVRYGILVNDFGELAIDDALIVAHDGETITLTNGCVCCTIGNDLLMTLVTLLDRDDPPEHIIIEASGVADPRPLANLSELDKRLRRRPVIVVGDAKTIMQQASDPYLHDTMRRQLKSAEILILNKCDTIGEAAHRDLVSWLNGQCAQATLFETLYCEVPTDLVLAGLDVSFDPTDEPYIHTPSHDSLFRAAALQSDQRLERRAFDAAVAALPPSVLRAKGFVSFIEEPGTQYLFQMSQGHCEISPVETKGPLMAVELVFIGTDQLPEQDWFQATFIGP